MKGSRRSWRWLGLLPACIVEGTTIASLGRGGAVAWSSTLTMLALVGRHRRRDDRAQAARQLLLIVVLALAVALGVLVVSRIVGPRVQYLVHWMSALGVVRMDRSRIRRRRNAVVDRSRGRAAVVVAAVTVGLVAVLVVALAVPYRDADAGGPGPGSRRRSSGHRDDESSRLAERRLPEPGRGAVAMRVPQPSFFAVARG